MAKISSTKKFILEDFPAEIRPWLKKLLEPLNKFLEQVYYSLVQGLTLTDNMKSSMQTVKFTAETVPSVKVAWTLNEKPSAVFVAQMSDDSGAVVPPYSVTWVYDQGQITVKLNGLTAASKYTIKILGMV